MVVHASGAILRRVSKLDFTIAAGTNCYFSRLGIVLVDPTNRVTVAVAPPCNFVLSVGFLAAALFEPSRWFLRRCLAVLALQAVIGVWGFVLHLIAGVNGISSSLYENFIHGAPVLAPMLFANLFLLGAIGIWDLLDTGDGAAAEG